MKLLVTHDPRRTVAADSFVAARIRRYERLGQVPPLHVESQRKRAQRLGVSVYKLRLIEAANG